MTPFIKTPWSTFTRLRDIDRVAYPTVFSNAAIVDQELQLVSPPAIPNARWINESFFSRSMGATIGYCVYLPEGYNAEREQYPVALFLHGLSVADPAPNEGTVAAWYPAKVDAASSAGLCRPHITLFPSGYNTSMWGNNRAGTVLPEVTLFETLEDFYGKYNASRERSRTVISGFSMGGFGALKFALKYRDRFAGAHALGAPMYAANLDPVNGKVVVGGANAPDIWQWFWYHYADSAVRYEANSPHWWVNRGNTALKPRLRIRWSAGDTLTWPTKIAAANTFVAACDAAGIECDDAVMTGNNWASIANPGHVAQTYYNYDTHNPSGVSNAFLFIEQVLSGV